MESLISITFYDVKIKNPSIYVSTLARLSSTVSNSMILDVFFQVFCVNKKNILVYVLKFYNRHYIKQRPHLILNAEKVYSPITIIALKSCLV